MGIRRQHNSNELFLLDDHRALGGFYGRPLNFNELKVMYASTGMSVHTNKSLRITAWPNINQDCKSHSWHNITKLGPIQTTTRAHCNEVLNLPICSHKNVLSLNDNKTPELIEIFNSYKFLYNQILDSISSSLNSSCVAKSAKDLFFLSVEIWYSSKSADQFLPVWIT